MLHIIWFISGVMFLIICGILLFDDIAAPDPVKYTISFIITVIFLGSTYMLFFQNNIIDTYNKLSVHDNITYLEKCNVYRYSADKCYNIKYRNNLKCETIPTEDQVWETF